MNVVNMQPLSDAGMPLALPEHLRGKVMVDHDGRILVAEGNGDESYLHVLVKRAEHLGLQLQGPDIVPKDKFREPNETLDDNRPRESLRKLVLELLAKGGSDLHVHARPDRAMAEGRIHGLITPLATFDGPYGHRLCAAAFQLCVSKDPVFAPQQIQAGRIPGHVFDPSLAAIRVQFTPMDDGGMLMVMRLHAHGGDLASPWVRDLGAGCWQQSCTAELKGLTLIIGPTGSGKTSMAHAMLWEARNQGAIITIEDPPERRLDFARQIHVGQHDDPKDQQDALTRALASAMRSDPDLLFVGELRHGPMAMLAMEAARTGHAVTATMHAGSSGDALARLASWGVHDHDLGAHLHHLHETRLVGVLCQKCARRPNDEEMAILRQKLGDEASSTRVRGMGCVSCVQGLTSRRALVRSHGPHPLPEWSELMVADILKGRIDGRLLGQDP